MSDRFLIWWTSQDDCRRIGQPCSADDIAAEEDRSGFVSVEDLPWPDYVVDEYQSRYGRAGRGRLWSVGRLGEVKAIWDDAKPWCRAAQDCGRIVIQAESAMSLAGWPGFITTLDMEIWRPPPEERSKG